MEAVITSLGDATEAFLLHLRAQGASSHTILRRDGILRALMSHLGDVAATTPAISRYLVSLRDRGLKPVTVWTHYNHLYTFFAWGVEAGLLSQNPMLGLDVKRPKDLPHTPTEEEVRALQAACKGDSMEATRNRALIFLLADSGLRISEALRLRIEQVNLGQRSLVVRSGKGDKDRAAFFGASTARAIRDYLRKRREAHLEDFLFVTQDGRPLKRRTVVQIFHRLSKKANLSYRMSPHKLRHFAATAMLRNGAGLEAVRKLLGHETLDMTLRYARLLSLDLAREFRRASPVDNLEAGR